MDNIAVAIPIIIGLTQVAKILDLPKRFIPLLAVILGIIYSGLIIGFGTEMIVSGTIVGLTSVGLYSGVKNTIKK